MFDSYPHYEALLAQLQLVLFMLGLGATLSRHDFSGIVRQPRFLLVGAAGQFLLSPFLAVAAQRWAGLEPGIAVGLILIAAMPGGTLSKVFAYLGRGNIALSITLTLFGTLASLATVPLLLRLLATGYVSDEFVMPVGLIVRDLLLYLLLPLAAGMVVAWLAPNGRRSFSRWCIRVGFVFVVAMVVGSLGSGRVQPGEYGWRTLLAIFFFCLVAQQASMLPFRLLGWPNPACLAVGIEVTMRNLNLALLLKAVLFPALEKGTDPIADGVLFVILIYAPVAWLLGLLLALNFRRMARHHRVRPGYPAAVEPVKAGPPAAT